MWLTFFIFFFVTLSVHCEDNTKAYNSYNTGVELMRQSKVDEAILFYKVSGTKVFSLTFITTNQ